MPHQRHGRARTPSDREASAGRVPWRTGERDRSRLNPEQSRSPPVTTNRNRVSAPSTRGALLQLRASFIGPARTMCRPMCETTMYQLGDIHLRLEAVTMVCPVHPLLGHEGVHGFDVIVGGHTYTAKYLDAGQARLAHARLLAALGGASVPDAVREPLVPVPPPRERSGAAASSKATGAARRR